MQQPIFIILQNINPAQNKHRVYHITVTGFSVQLRWGRINCHARQKLVTFRKEAEVLKFLEATLKKRERHGYQVAVRSGEFPVFESLGLIQAEPFIPVQLALFS